MKWTKSVPLLIVHELVPPKPSGYELREAILQAENWRVQHPNVGGRISGCREGYQFRKPFSHRVEGYHYQFTPDLSYFDESTWSRLSGEEANLAYVSCVPTVTKELLSATDSIEDIHAKVTKFVDAGTREGVVVDTGRDRIWIYYRGQPPYVAALAPIEFESWPGFTLDCLAIRDTRTQAGFT